MDIGRTNVNNRLTLEDAINTDLILVTQALGKGVYGDRKTLCPFHDDIHPSLLLTAPGNRYKCFVCGEAGSTIDLVKKVKDCSTGKAIQFINNISGIPSSAILERKFETLKRDIDPDVLKIRNAVIYYMLACCESISDIGRAYLNGRGITNEAISYYRITDIKSSNKLAIELYNVFDMDKLKASGVFTETGNFRFANHKLLFPYFRKGKVTYLQSRMIGDFKEPYLNLPGQIPHLYNNEAIYRYDEIFLCESILDMISLSILLGYKDCVVASIGVNFLDTWIPQFKGKTVYLAYDNDEAGNKNAHLHAEKFAEHQIEAIPFLTYSPYKDWNKYLCRKK